MSCIYMTKRIGGTTYRVKIYTTDKGTEIMEDKILRIIQNHPLANGEKCDTINVSQMSCSA